jgi:peptide/nickel transport system permease protein
VSTYIVRRLIWALVVLLVVAVVTFFLTYVLPADPARAIAGPRASAEDVARIRHALGLDQPFLVQLFAYLERILQGDFGHSYKQDRDVLPLLLGRFPATLQLAFGGILVELAIGIPLGVIAATRRGTNSDRLATIASTVLIALPSFWVGYILLNVLAFQPLMAFGLSIFPLGGYQPLDLRYLALPALTLGFSGAAYYVRLTRTTMIDELQRDYVRTARAKGAPPRTVTWRHAFRNSLPPLLSQLGLDFGWFLGGVVVVENVFSWPGIGRLAVQSIVTSDVPLIMGTVLFGTLCIVLANLLVDLAYVLVDPRVRL